MCFCYYYFFTAIAKKSFLWARLGTRSNIRNSIYRRLLNLIFLKNFYALYFHQMLERGFKAVQKKQDATYPGIIIITINII